MADIELVIKISKEKYESIKNDAKQFLSIPGHNVPYLYEAINKGTPLPEGHGDLVDASMSYGEWVCTQDGNYECVREGGCENCEYSEYQCYTDIRDLPVIIKADKESEEK